jgi:hypothetical protein
MMLAAAVIAYADFVTNPYVGSIDVAIWIKFCGLKLHTIVIIWNNVTETVSLTIPFQSCYSTLTLETFFGNHLKFGEKLTLEFALKNLSLNCDTY